MDCPQKPCFHGPFLSGVSEESFVNGFNALGINETPLWRLISFHVSLYMEASVVDKFCLDANLFIRFHYILSLTGHAGVGE